MSMVTHDAYEELSSDGSPDLVRRDTGDPVLEMIQFIGHAVGPVTLEVLLERLPQYRWIDVLKRVSQLWGEGRIDVIQDQGSLQIYAVSMPSEGLTHDA